MESEYFFVILTEFNEKALYSQFFNVKSIFFLQ